MLHFNHEESERAFFCIVQPLTHSFALLHSPPFSRALSHATCPRMCVFFSTPSPILIFSAQKTPGEYSPSLRQRDIKTTERYAGCTKCWYCAHSSLSIRYFACRWSRSGCRKFRQQSAHARETDIYIYIYIARGWKKSRVCANNGLEKIRHFLKRAAPREMEYISCMNFLISTLSL